eukprot:765618-Hanusia_phi.AAC.1
MWDHVLALSIWHGFIRLSCLYPNRVSDIRSGPALRGVLSLALPVRVEVSDSTYSLLEPHTEKTILLLEILLYDSCYDLFSSVCDTS